MVVSKSLYLASTARLRLVDLLPSMRCETKILTCLDDAEDEMISYRFLNSYILTILSGMGGITFLSGKACERGQVTGLDSLFYPDLRKINFRGKTRTYDS